MQPGHGIQGRLQTLLRHAAARRQQAMRQKAALYNKQQQKNRFICAQQRCRMVVCEQGVHLIMVVAHHRSQISRKRYSMSALGYTPACAVMCAVPSSCCECHSPTTNKTAPTHLACFALPGTMRHCPRMFSLVWRHCGLLALLPILCGFISLNSLLFPRSENDDKYNTPKIAWQAASQWPCLKARAPWWLWCCTQWA